MIRHSPFRRVSRLHGLGDAALIHTYGMNQAGVFLYVRADGSYYFADASGAPVSYSPTAADLTAITQYQKFPGDTNPSYVQADQSALSAIAAMIPAAAPAQPASSSPPAGCTPAPAWYQVNPDGTYTQYSYVQSSCGGTVISAAQWAAQTGQQPPAQNAAPAVTPSGQTVSTQTGQAAHLVNIAAVANAPGVYQCSYSDGLQQFCDVDGNPVTYNPPPAQPVVTPAAGSLPTSVVSPTVPPSLQVAPVAVTSGGQLISAPATPVAVTPSGQPISTTSGTPAPAPAAAPATGFDLTSLLTGSLFGGIPNWVLLAGAGLLLLSGDSGSRRRR